MKKNHKLILLGLTVLPIILIPFIVVWAIGGAFHLESFENPDAGVATYVGGIVFLAILAGIISLIVWVYYLVHVIQNQSIDSNERLIWILLFIFAGLIPQIVYFFLRIWNLPEPDDRYIQTST